MWNKLTTLGKLLVILFGLIPFFVASHFIGNNYALTGIIFISSLIVLFLVVTFGTAISEYNKERKMERERERNAHNRVILNFNDVVVDNPYGWSVPKSIKRVFTKEDPYGEEDWDK